MTVSSSGAGFVPLPSLVVDAAGDPGFASMEVSAGGGGGPPHPVLVRLGCKDDESTGSWATTLSWIVNWFLLVAKVYIVIVSGSKSVLAAMVDSVVDLVSQSVLSAAEHYMARYDADYPVGRARLEALSVLACAFIMAFASVEVIQASGEDLYQGIAHGNFPELEASSNVYGTIVAGIVAKFVLWHFCRWAQKVLKSDMLEALAEDHFNDVLSNSAAIATLLIATYVSGAWWVDALGGIVISLVIIVRWVYIGFEQVKKIIGHTAPDEFIARLEEIAQLHDSRLMVDCTRAYHFGARYNVEMEIILPGSMTVAESHDIALSLQHKIEGLSEVERAFIHVDHEERDGLEHKVERDLVKNAIFDSSPLASSPSAAGAPGTPGSAGGIDIRKRINTKRRPDDMDHEAR